MASEDVFNVLAESVASMSSDSVPAVSTTHDRDFVHDEVVGTIDIAPPAPISRSFANRWQRCFVAFALRMALKSLQKNNPRRAFSILKPLEKTGLSVTLIRPLLARCACLLGEESRARRLLLSQPFRFPVSKGRLGSYFRRIGDIHCEILDFTDALRCLEHAERLLPGSAAVKDSLARYFLNAKNDVDAASHVFQKQSQSSRSEPSESEPGLKVAPQGENLATNPYDIVPYKSRSFQQTHPITLATVAMLYGLLPQSVEGCRVLELGCATGGNLLPMAEQFPESQFLGIDASSCQVNTGNELRKQAGLTNVELRCQNILEFSSETPFDYIICHGVYSWVPDMVKQKILDICQTSLTPNGVAYISYNTFPYWHMNAIVRDIMMFCSRSRKDPGEKLSTARRVVRKLSNSVREQFAIYRALLERGSSDVDDRNEDYYIIHEYLEEVNTPVQFHEFAERARDSGLQYLGDANYGGMTFEGFTNPELRLLMSLSRNIIEVEQYRDFLLNRSFRQTLLCRAAIEPDRKMPYRRMRHLRAASDVKPESPNPDLTSSKPVTFIFSGDRKAPANDPIVKAALYHLGTAWPLSIPFVELASLASSTATGKSLEIIDDAMPLEMERLARKLLHYFGDKMVSLVIASPQIAASVGERPCASPLMRAQAASGNLVTNAKHVSLSLDDIQRQVLLACDGRHSIDNLVSHLSRKVLNGELKAKCGERYVTDADAATRLAMELVSSTLTSLAKMSLFVT